MKKSTTELFVAYRDGFDIDEVFTTLIEAEEAAEKFNIQHKLISRTNPYKAMTLDTAIYLLKVSLSE
ncbi:hypothetical protein M0P65_07415 [Candidatus Gracilibacteria bacterium]|jgi:hypothetical protein|nr:hypothetical protein [Candidatus Gracilibacteria bacterium]